VETFIGDIRLFGFNFAPQGWASCEGQTMPIAQYTALFSLLGTTYGGDGQTTFRLPDLRGRAPIGFGQAPGGTTFEQGETVAPGATATDQSTQPGHLALNWCIALEGIYPSRP
jgi:microcystin-dependent protein